MFDAAFNELTAVTLLVTVEPDRLSRGLGPIGAGIEFWPGLPHRRSGMTQEFDGCPLDGSARRRYGMFGIYMALGQMLHGSLRVHGLFGWYALNA